MQPAPRAQPTRPSWHASGFFLWTTTLFVAVWAYVYLRIQPAIQLHSSDVAFLYGADFLKPFLREPGGLAEYAGAFLARCDALPLLGSLIQGILTLTLMVLTWSALTPIFRLRFSLLALTPSFLLLVLRQAWGYSCFPLALGLAIALGLALLLNFTTRWVLPLRIAVCWAGALAVSYLGGPLACLVYACSAAACDFARNKSPTTALAFLSSGLIPVAWAFVSHYPDYWKESLPVATLLRVLVIILAAYIPVVVLLLSFLSSPAASPETVHPAKKHKDHKHEKPPVWTRAEPIATTALFVAGWVILWAAFDQPRHFRAAVDFYSSRGEHEKVIQLVSKLQPSQVDAASELRLHRALYHTGRLGSDLFSYTNLLYVDLLPSLAGELRNCRPQAESLLELGLVNDAEHLAHEALEWEGDRPDLLRLLAKINILSDRPQAARVFLTLLARIPFETGSAREALARLDAEPALAADGELALIRHRMLTKDIAHDVFVAEPLLSSLLDRNTTNRMAFDYLMTSYLLSRDIGKLAGDLPRLEQFADQQIPTHWEEALLIHRSMTGEQPKLARLKVRDSTQLRFKEFMQTLDQEAKAKRNPLPALSVNFRGTFWFYYMMQQLRNRNASS